MIFAFGNLIEDRLDSEGLDCGNPVVDDGHWKGL